MAKTTGKCVRLCETEARFVLTSVTVNATAFTCKYDRRPMAAVGDTCFFCQYDEGPYVAGPGVDDGSSIHFLKLKTLHTAPIQLQRAGCVYDAMAAQG